jgi:hypothetical protein
MIEKFIELSQETDKSLVEFIEAFFGGNIEVFYKKIKSSGDSIPASILLDLYHQYPASTLKYVSSVGDQELNELIFEVLDDHSRGLSKDGDEYFYRIDKLRDFEIFFDRETKEDRWLTQGFWDIDCYDYWNDVISSENKKNIKNFSDYEKSIICIFIETAIKFLIKDKINSKIFQTISDYLGYPDGSGVREDGNGYILNVTKMISQLAEDTKELIENGEVDNSTQLAWDNGMFYLIRFTVSIEVEFGSLVDENSIRKVSKDINNYITTYLSSKKNERTTKST